MPGGWAGKTYNRLLATNPQLAQTILETPIQVVTIQAPSYWEAAIAVYPQICGHTHKTVLKEVAKGEGHEVGAQSYRVRRPTPQ